jgi:hypothetical protein
MDPSLLRDRELFKKRALSTPVVEKRAVPSESPSSSSSKKKKAKVEHGGSSGSKQNSGEENCFGTSVTIFREASNGTFSFSFEIWTLCSSWLAWNFLCRQDGPTELAALPPRALIDLCCHTKQA